MGIVRCFRTKMVQVHFYENWFMMQFYLDFYALQSKNNKKKKYLLIQPQIGF